MNKLPSALWALGFGAWMDCADYLDFLQGKPQVHDATYGGVSLAFWIGGILLFWPWRRPR